MFHVWYNFDGQVRSKLLECWYIWGITKVKSLGGVKDLTFSSRGAFVSKLKDDPGQFQGSRIIFAGDIKVEGIQWVIIIIKNNTTFTNNIINNNNTTAINIITIAPQKGSPGPAFQQARAQLEDREGGTKGQWGVHLRGCHHHPHCLHHCIDIFTEVKSYSFSTHPHYRSKGAHYFRRSKFEQYWERDLPIAGGDERQKSSQICCS